MELEDGIIGLLHRNEISSGGKLEPSSILKKNEEIEVEIMSIESDTKRISLSIKYRL